MPSMPERAHEFYYYNFVTKSVRILVDVHALSFRHLSAHFPRGATGTYVTTRPLRLSRNS
jgi:hypothetical protein